MKVVITNAAKADLVSIAEFISQNNPQRAVSFVDELLDRCVLLGDTPRAYALLHRYKHYGVRRCIHGDYLIFYRISEDFLEIIHILHGARNYETLLFSEN